MIKIFKCNNNYTNKLIRFLEIRRDQKNNDVKKYSGVLLCNYDELRMKKWLYVINGDETASESFLDHIKKPHHIARGMGIAIPYHMFQFDADKILCQWPSYRYHAIFPSNQNDREFRIEDWIIVYKNSLCIH